MRNKSSYTSKIGVMAKVSFVYIVVVQHKKRKVSIPRNHHFVSQIHIKNFFNKSLNRIFVYDKKLDSFYFKNTTKTLFSEKDLNTSFNNKKKDFETLEKDLNLYIEKYFSKNYAILLNFMKNLVLTEEVRKAIIGFVYYGAIGEIRNPRNKQVLENVFYDTIYNRFYNKATDELKRGIDELFAYKKETKYINIIQYSELASRIVKSMGDIVFVIETPSEESDYFLLPDFCSATIRAKINTYFNPDIKEIAYIGLPLSSKVYIHFYSSKLKNINLKSEVFYTNSENVYNINKRNFEFCESKVSCENEEYLKKFIKRCATP